MNAEQRTEMYVMCEHGIGYWLDYEEALDCNKGCTDDDWMIELRPYPERPTVFFNPLAFDIDTNNRFLALGYEPLPIDQWKRPEHIKSRLMAGVPTSTSNHNRNENSIMGTSQEQFFEEESGGAGYTPVKFNVIGDTVTGVIVDTPKVVVRPNLNDNSPENQLPVNLDTKGDGNEEDYVTLWLRKGVLLDAVKEAYEAAGAKGLAVGGRLGVKFTEERDTGKPNKLKMFKAQYEPPKASETSVDDIF